MKALHMLSHLNEIPRNVLVFIAEHSSPDGMLIYPAKDMGRQLGYSEFEVKDALDYLEKQGVIDVREGLDHDEPNAIIYKEEWINHLGSI